MNRDYIQNSNQKISYKGVMVLTPQEVVEAMNYANTALKELSDTTMRFDINIFETLGMRNLSGMIGEYFASRSTVTRISSCPYWPPARTPSHL